LTCVSSVRKTSLRLDGFFPLVKPIIAAVTSRLLTGPRLPSWLVNVSVLYVGMAKRDGQDKPQFSYLMWWCYYGRHILIKHYLNTLYPSSGSVSYSSEMWKEGREERQKKEKENHRIFRSTYLHSRNDEDGGGPSHYRYYVFFFRYCSRFTPFWSTYQKIASQHKSLSLFDIS